jgi:hypothetical protein
MSHTKHLAFALLLFILAAGALTAGGEAFSGAFDGKAFDGKYGMEWVFKKDKDSVSVSVMIFQDIKGKSKKSLSRGPGKNVKIDGDKLEFEIDWVQSQPKKGPPKDAKYVAEIKDNKLTVNWTAGDDKGELTATNRNPQAIAKKDGKKKDESKKPAAEKLYLSDLIDAKGIPVQKGMVVTKLGMVIVMGNKSKALDLKVTKDTKFIVMDGDEAKTFDQKTVLDDPAIRASFRERFVTIERQAGVALSVTTTPAKKK